jgi:hypothetical protein
VNIRLRQLIWAGGSRVLWKHAISLFVYHAQENYGKWDPTCVEKVKALYTELNLEVSLCSICTKGEKNLWHVLFVVIAYVSTMWNSFTMQTCVTCLLSSRTEGVLSVWKGNLWKADLRYRVTTEWSSTSSVEILFAQDLQEEEVGIISGRIILYPGVDAGSCCVCVPWLWHISLTVLLNLWETMSLASGENISNKKYLSQAFTKCTGDLVRKNLHLGVPCE